MTGSFKKSNNTFARSEKEFREEKKVVKKKRKAKLNVRVAKIKKTKKKSFEKMHITAPRKAKKKEAKPNLEKLSREYGLDREETEHIKERIDASKRMIIISGVSFFMILVVVFWFFNTKYSITKVSVGDETTDVFDTWKNISAEMQDNLDQIQNDVKVIDNLKNKITDVASSTNSTPEATSTVKVLPMTSDDLSASTSLEKNSEVVELLVDKLNGLEPDIN